MQEHTQPNGEKMLIACRVQKARHEKRLQPEKVKKKKHP